MIESEEERAEGIKYNIVQDLVSRLGFDKETVVSAYNVMNYIYSASQSRMGNTFNTDHVYNSWHSKRNDDQMQSMLYDAVWIAICESRKRVVGIEFGDDGLGDGELETSRAVLAV